MGHTGRGNRAHTHIQFQGQDFGETGEQGFGLSVILFLPGMPSRHFSVQVCAMACTHGMPACLPQHAMPSPCTSHLALLETGSLRLAGLPPQVRWVGQLPTTPAQPGLLSCTQPFPIPHPAAWPALHACAFSVFSQLQLQLPHAAAKPLLLCMAFLCLLTGLLCLPYPNTCLELGCHASSLPHPCHTTTPTHAMPAVQLWMPSCLTLPCYNITNCTLSHAAAGLHCVLHCAFSSACCTAACLSCLCQCP